MVLVDNNDDEASELAKLREQYSTVRREREQLLAEVANIRALSEKDAAARREEVSALKGVIERHMMEEVTTSTCSCRTAGDCININDTIRALKVDVAELTARSNTLSDENADLRAALDVSESSREAMLSAHEQALAELLTESALIEADKQRALRQISVEKKSSEEHAQEARFAISALAEAKERVATLEHELLRHRQVSESTIDQLKLDSNAKFKLIAMERDDLKERVAALEEMILREASSSESSTDKGDDDFGADTCTSNNTREGLILLQRQYSQLEHQVFQLESERGNVEAENKRLLHACETCKLDNEMIAKQKEALASQCSLVEKRLELQSDDACKVKAEMERLKSESEANKERAIELEERYDAIEEDKGIMKIKLERIEKDLLSARKRQGSSEKALEKEVQRAALYRQKALEAHERSQRAKEALACLTLNVSEN
jgi:chromosome segregation ATPase